MGEIVNGYDIDQNKSGKSRVKKTLYRTLSAKKRGTYRFGEYGIFGVWNGINNDDFKIRSFSEVDSFSLAAPLKANIHMNKTTFMVTRMALLPNLWEKIYVNPSIGEDVNATIYGTSVPAEIITNHWSWILTNLGMYLSDSASVSSLDDVKDNLKTVLNYMNLAEMWFSNGSLVNSLGAHVAKLCKLYEEDAYLNLSWKGKDYDDIYNEIWKGITAKKITIKFLNENNEVIVADLYETDSPSDLASLTLNDYGYMRKREFQNSLRDGMIIKEIQAIGDINGAWTDEAAYMDIFDDFAQSKLQIVPVGYDEPFDTARLWSYQLSCAEFFTNDKVDYIYNANLYREYIASVIKTANISIAATTQINGIYIPVDYLSAWYFDQVNNELMNGDPSDLATLPYWYALLKYNRSLKFKDYFTGSRTRPLAIGDTNVPVVGGDHVEIIDVTKNIQRQRFLNVLNKIPATLKGYSKGIMGRDVAPDWHSPLFLSRTSEIIYGQEVENTGEAQMKEAVSRTSVLKNSGGKFQFNFSLDRDAIIIGIIDFDIERDYSQGINRSFMHVDRFDMFNPYMQYTGDQPVYKEEYMADKSGTFGYQGAYMEFKQEVNDCFGGWIKNLPGWTFNDRFTNKLYGNNAIVNKKTNIGPDFIRSKPEELDRFYISLTGENMAEYYHFIIDTYNEVEATRPMAYNPQILM